MQFQYNPIIYYTRIYLQDYFFNYRIGYNYHILLFSTQLIKRKPTLSSFFLLSIIISNLLENSNHVIDVIVNVKFGGGLGIYKRSWRSRIAKSKRSGTGSLVTWKI